MRGAAHIRALAAIGLTLAAAGCGSSSQTNSATTSSAAGGPTATVRTCAGAQLAPSYAGTDGATGHMEVTIALRNVSAHPCRIIGYPAARLLGAGGATLSFRVLHGHGFFPDTMTPPKRVLIRPGTSAHFGISFPTNNEYSGAHTCRVVTAAMSAVPLRATPQWRRISLRRAPRISPCGDRLILSPIHA
ncbi:MAG: DUF4232 domain-containing protein [Solirubrobacteraceae bacterium]